MSSPLATAMRAIETSTLPWTPVGLRNTLVDMMFYDMSILSSKELQTVLMPTREMPEGAIVIVEPEETDGTFTVCDLREYQPDHPLCVKGENIDTIVVAGCGSSAVGAVAFGRTVAKALGRPVASIIPGCGVGDAVFEAFTGAFIFAPINWQLHAVDPYIHKFFHKAIVPLNPDSILDFVYELPEAGTLHRLLLDHGEHIKLIVGHSKGNYAISSALHALVYSFQNVTAAKVGTLKDMIDLDVLTFGCWVQIPENLPEEVRGIRCHQYIGTLDTLGTLNSPPTELLKLWGTWLGQVSQEAVATWLGKEVKHVEKWRTDKELTEALVPNAAHNIVSWNQYHMPAEKVIALYDRRKAATAPEQPVTGPEQPVTSMAAE